jgi:hypothetical protein
VVEHERKNNRRRNKFFLKQMLKLKEGGLRKREEIKRKKTK